MAADRFSPHIEVVARKLCGEPNARLSSKEELRFGTHGSLSVDLVKGTFYDHEAAEGGGVLDLVARYEKVRNGDAVEWLRTELNLDIEDPRPAPEPIKRKVVATYDYTDAAGLLVFQVVRFEPKNFLQRRPDRSSVAGWTWSVKEAHQVPYRLPELIEAIALDQVVFITEGEKDADNLASANLPATCNAGGAGKWPEPLTQHFAGADVVILPHNDTAGKRHVETVGAALSGTAKRIRVLELEGLEPKGDVSDWLAAGNRPGDLYALADAKARMWEPGPPVSAFGAVPWSQLDFVDARRDWLVEDVLYTGDFALQYGASQSGKSFLAVDMALCIARGARFFEKKTRKGGVIYQAGEGGLGLINRLKAYRQHNSVSGNLPFVLLPKRVDLYATDAENGIDAFLAEIAAQRAWLTEPLALVVIDTYATATVGANENASEDVSRALRNIQKVQEASGAAVMVVHHKNAGGERPRGHTSLYANADTALEVIREEDNPSQRAMRVAKVKDGEDGEVIGFKLHGVQLGTNDDGKPITSCVVVPAQVGVTQSGRRLPSGQRQFLQILDSAVSQYGGQLPPNINGPTDAYGCQWHSFRTLYAAIRGVTLEDNAIRQALLRDGDALFEKRLIGKDNPWIWITERGHRELLRNEP